MIRFEVEDFFVQVIDESAGTTRLRRRITMSSEAQRDGLRFRVFTAPKITEVSGGLLCHRKIEHQNRFRTCGSTYCGRCWSTFGGADRIGCRQKAAIDDRVLLGISFKAGLQSSAIPDASLACTTYNLTKHY